jgi:DNA polymerase (family 10)
MELENLTGVGKVLAKKITEYIRAHKLPKQFANYIKLREIREMLPESAIQHLKYLPNNKIPRKRLQCAVTAIERAGGVVAGSWRRGLDFCNDLDILLPHGTNIEKFIENTKLHFTPPFANGNDNVRMFVKYAPGCYTHADIFLYHDYAAHLLHSTGSKEFNIRMRSIAKSRGYLLNQHGLFKNDVKVPAASEEDLFAILNMTFLEPHQRN